MKGIKVKKISGRRIIILAMQVVFVLILGYQIFNLYKLYQSLYVTADSKSVGAKAPRSDISAYKQAVERFENAKTYTAPDVNVATPFKAPPKGTGEEPF
jgi:hypothetical protein